MKQWSILPIAVLLSIVASVATTQLSESKAAPSPDPAGPTTSLDARLLEQISLSLAGIEERQRKTEGSIEQLRMRASSGIGSGSRVEVGGIDEAVARWMAEHALAGSTESTEDHDGLLAGGVAEGSVEDLLDLLLNGELDGIATQELWQQLRDEGRLDEVIAEFERRAELNPLDPDLQKDLGNAYLQKIFEVGNGPLAGVFGTKADEAFDRALELDENHWEARLTKAIALSNWPAFTGKTGEAIRNFEILVEQQQNQPASPHFAQTYYFLGNMYQQTGNQAKALEIWQQGLGRYPDSEMLRQQLAGAGQ
jgi:tetratricopeptide (TPR) repeat protein